MGSRAAGAVRLVCKNRGERYLYEFEVPAACRPWAHCRNPRRGRGCGRGRRRRRHERVSQEGRLHGRRLGQQDHAQRRSRSSSPRPAGAPAWIAPGPAVNGKKALKGKTIVTFPISSEIDACNTKGQQGYYDAEAKALGAKVIPLQSNTGPAGWQANLSQAVTDKASAVVMLCGPSAAAVAPQLASLKSAHIPVVDGNYNQTGGSAGVPVHRPLGRDRRQHDAGRQDRSGRRAGQPEGQGRLTSCS